MTSEEATKKLDFVEQWSRNNAATRASRLIELNQTIAMLQSGGSVATQLLFERLADKKRELAFRANCAQMIREMGAAIPAAELPAIRAMIGGSREDTSLRIYAAHFLLRDKQAAESDKKVILDLAENIMRSGGDKANVGLLIMPHFRGNARASQIMLDELKRGGEQGPSLHVLGKVGHPGAVGPIESLLNSRFSDRAFPYKTRAYLALGEIGGPRAYDSLLGYLAREKSEREQHMIVRGLGLTRDPRAKAQLLRYLSDGPDHFYTSALRALQYFGDTSVIPELERELARQQNPHRRQKIQALIEALKAGRTAAEW
jgi:hypothetical protein